MQYYFSIMVSQNLALTYTFCPPNGNLYKLCLNPGLIPKVNSKYHLLGSKDKKDIIIALKGLGSRVG